MRPGAWLVHACPWYPELMGEWVFPLTDPDMRENWIQKVGRFHKSVRMDDAHFSTGLFSKGTYCGQDIHMVEIFINYFGVPTSIFHHFSTKFVQKRKNLLHNRFQIFLLHSKIFQKSLIFVFSKVHLVGYNKLQPWARKLKQYFLNKVPQQNLQNRNKNQHFLENFM